MKGIFNQHKNPLGINGKPVEIKQIIDTQAVVILPNGKKTFLQVANLVSLCGELTFTSEASADVIPDQENQEVATQEKTAAPLFEPEVTDTSFGMEAAVADETDENPEVNQGNKKSKK
jgi:hypothetical protein